MYILNNSDILFKFRYISVCKCILQYINTSYFISWLIKLKKSLEFTKGISLLTIKICQFEIIDGVKYVYCTKHAYKFLPREQLGFAAVLWRLRQCVSCFSFYKLILVTCAINICKNQLVFITQILDISCTNTILGSQCHINDLTSTFNFENIVFLLDIYFFYFMGLIFSTSHTHVSLVLRALQPSSQVKA